MTTLVSLPSLSLGAAPARAVPVVTPTVAPAPVSASGAAGAAAPTGTQTAQAVPPSAALSGAIAAVARDIAPGIARKDLPSGAILPPLPDPDPPVGPPPAFQANMLEALRAGVQLAAEASGEAAGPRLDRSL